MNKKKILGLALAALIGVTGGISALTTSSANAETTTTTSATSIENKHQKGKHSDLTLEEKAEKLGIDISGLSTEEAETAVKDAFAQKKGEMKNFNVEEKAAELGIDISGLSEDEAKAAVKDAIKESKGNEEKSSKRHHKHKGLSDKSSESSSDSINAEQA